MKGTKRFGSLLIAGLLAMAAYGCSGGGTPAPTSTPAANATAAPSTPATP